MAEKAAEFMAARKQTREAAPDRGRLDTRHRPPGHTRMSCPDTSTGMFHQCPWQVLKLVR